MLPPDLMNEARQLHEGPDRGYHSWSHPQALLALLEEVRADLNDPLAVECAIVFHDAVYDPLAADNEKRSAALAKAKLAGVVPDPTLQRAVLMIEASERHAVPDALSPSDALDCRIFLDLDLSILGSGEAAFDAYEAGVRFEYRHVTQAAFNAGRAGVLRRFLMRDSLYLSPWGRARFEAKARANLQRSLNALEGS